MTRMAENGQRRETGTGISSWSKPNVALSITGWRRRLGTPEGRPSWQLIDVVRSSQQAGPPLIHCDGTE